MRIIRGARIMQLTAGLLFATGDYAFADVTVTAIGRAFCYDGTTQRLYPLEGARVELMDSDCDGSQICDDLMGVGRVAADGSFSVTGSGGDPGWIGTSPDVYVRFAYNDDDGVRLTDELDSTRSWSTPEHDHDNTGGGVIDFGDWVTGMGVGAGEGTQCGVWRQGRLAYQRYKTDSGAAPPAGHLDIEYWSGVYSGTPWTNTDTIHWPIHFYSTALPHEFGHSIRHAADGNGAHFSNDVFRFQYARTHSECDADGNRNPGEIDSSLAGYAFNEGWAEYWDGDIYGCGEVALDEHREGVVAHYLSRLQTENHLTRKQMVDVLIANPGSIHSFSEFSDRLAAQFPGKATSALTEPAGHNLYNFRAYSAADLSRLTAYQLAGMDARVSDFRAKAHATAETYQRPVEGRCINCEGLFRSIVGPILFEAEAAAYELRIRDLKNQVSTHWTDRVHTELSAGRYETLVTGYLAELEPALRAIYTKGVDAARAAVIARRVEFTPSSYDAALSELSKAARRLAAAGGAPEDVTDHPRGLLPQVSLQEDMGVVKPDSTPAGGSPAVAAVTLPGTAEWLDTGITVQAGQRISISATGLWSNSGPANKGPKGFEGYHYPGTILASADLASLIAKVGNAVFAVGDRFDGASAASGRLYLSINDTPGTFGDNQGALKVTVSKY